MAFAATQEMVAAYNEANQADYRLLPSSCYSIDAGTFDAEALSLVYGITLDASALDPDYVYLLPLKMVSSDYTVLQDNIYYVKVTIQEIQFSVSKTDRYEAATRLSHEIKLDVVLNGALADDVPVEFVYVASVEAHALRFMEQPRFQRQHSEDDHAGLDQQQLHESHDQTDRYECQRRGLSLCELLLQLVYRLPLVRRLERDLQ